MRRVAVVGLGVTKFGKHERTCAELFAEAAVEALTDADIRPRQVQGVYVGNVVGEAGERQLHLGPQVTSALGIPAVAATRFETACASSHAAFRHALFEIGSGAADVLLVGGAERVLTMPTERSTEVFAYASDAVFEQPAGLTFPGVFALIARAHMAKHGTTEEQMAHVAVKNHRHGTLNPKAQFRKEITLEQVLRSAKVADPLKLYDCCPFSDGAAAVVLASEEIARRTRKPVWVLGSAQAGRLDVPPRQAGPLARRGDRARGPGRVPAGGPDTPGRRRGRAPRLLHDRRDRRDRGPRPLRAGRGRDRGGEGRDEPRRPDPGQRVGRAQGQGSPDRGDGRGAGRPRSPRSSAARPTAGRWTARRSGSPTRSAGTPRACS